MSTVLFADGVLGKVVIADHTVVDAALTNPRSYIANVKLHSDFKYLGISSATTVTATVLGSNPTRATKRAVIAHGLGGIPLVSGTVLGLGSGGANVPLVGSVPIWNSGNYKNAVFWTLGADATYVYLHELWSRSDLMAGSPNPSGVTYSVQVLIHDRLL